VLIYFDAQWRRDVVRRLIDSLAPGGFLFVGYSESLREFDALEAVATRGAVLYRKPDGDRPPVAARPRAPAVAAPPDRPPAPPPAATPAPALIDQSASTAILELSGRYEGAERLTRELGALLSGGFRRVVIELDGAEYLDDSAGPVLRRAARTARSAGVEVILVAERQGTRRWLTRSGAVDEASCEAIERDPHGGEGGA
jgi:anti-anti-sigma regulatory factor